MEATLRQTRPVPNPLVMLYTGVIGFASIALTHQILTGWVALSDRKNISRSDLNMYEWIVAIVALLLGLGALRTTWALFTGEKVAIKWAQWMSFIFILVGLTLTLNSILGPTQYGKLVDYFNIVSFLIGFVVLATSVAIYQMVAPGDEHAPLKILSIQFSESPSAGAILGFLVIFVVFSMSTSLFLNPTSIASVLSNTATKGIIAIGITILMISGEFDLSVGSVLGASSMIFMLGMTEGYHFFGVEVGPFSATVAALIALAVAALMGLINGLLLVFTRIPSFIVTLGTLFIYRAIVLVAIAGGRILRYADYYNELPQIYINRWIIVLLAGVGLVSVGYLVYYLTPRYVKHLSDSFAAMRQGQALSSVMTVISLLRLVLTVGLMLLVMGWLVLVALYHLERTDSTLQVGFFDVANGRWSFTGEQVTEPIRPLLDEFTDVTGIATTVSIPRNSNFRMAIVWWVVMVAFFQIILMYTRYGNAVFAVGGNIGAARAQGINANLVKIQNFVLCSFLAGVAAIFEVARNPGVDPLKGDKWELEVITMTVIGGTLLSGGYGGIIGTLLGALILGMLQTGLVLVEQQWGIDTRAFQGVVGIFLIGAVFLNNMTKRNR